MALKNYLINSPISLVFDVTAAGFNSQAEVGMAKIIKNSHYRRISTEDEQFESESELDGTAVKDRNC